MFTKTISLALLATGVLAAPKWTHEEPTWTHEHEATKTVSLTGVTHSVVAGLNGLNFEPNNVVAEIGDVVQWEFLPANHSVAQSSFGHPCHPLAGGSGFFPGFEFGATEGKSDNVFQIVVESHAPIWYYCPQTVGDHCKRGMVGVINQDFYNPAFSLARHTELAADTDHSIIPDTIQGGEVLFNPNP